MSTVLVIVVALVALAVVLLLVFTPKIRERQGAASRFAKEQVGGEAAVVRIDGMANGFGDEPATGAELRGPGALALGPTSLVFALTPERSTTIARSAIVRVETTADAGDTGKSMLKVVHTVDGEEVTTSWRLRDAAAWAEALRG